MLDNEPKPFEEEKGQLKEEDLRDPNSQNGPNEMFKPQIIKAGEAYYLVADVKTSMVKQKGDQDIIGSVQTITAGEKVINLLMVNLCKQEEEYDKVVTDNFVTFKQRSS